MQQIQQTRITPHMRNCLPWIIMCTLNAINNNNSQEDLTHYNMFFNEHQCICLCTFYVNDSLENSYSNILKFL